MKNAVIALLAAAAATLGVSSSQAQVQATQIATGFARPVFITSAPGEFGRIYVVEQWSGTTGRITIYNTAAGTRSTFLSLTVAATDEQGMLGLAFHPDYQTNRKFYIYFTDPSGVNHVREYQRSVANPDLADPATAREIFSVLNPQTNHNGGWIAFGPDGYLYVAKGDGGNRDDAGPGHSTGGNAQDITSNFFGKMLRIDINSDDFPADSAKNYHVPNDNPFVNQTGDDEIWSYGLRNPWRNSFDRLTGQIWIADVGQDVWEEVDKPANNGRGANFGWRCWEATHCTALSGCDCVGATPSPPVYEYQHLNNRCAITGGYVYRGCAIPSLYGMYIFADYCTGEVFKLNPANNQVTPLLATNPGALITSFGEDAYGEIWITRQGGRIYKLSPSGAPQFLDCNANGRPDCWDIADGTAQDCNQNGIPDSCEPACPADFNGDCFLDFFDADSFVTCFDGGACPPGKSADFNGDGFVDFFDLDAFIQAFENGC